MSPHQVCAVLLVVLASGSPIPAGAFSHSWSHGYGTATCKGVAVDPLGDVVVIGEYAGSLDFGGGPLPTPDLYGNMCIAKFSPAGTHLWSKAIGGFDVQSARAVAIDADGTIVIAGEFPDEVNIDGTIHSATGTMDIFVARLGADGHRIWSKSFGNASNASAVTGCGLDALGNVYLSGSGGGNDYGGGAMPTSADIHLVKFDADGNHLWSYGYSNTALDGLTPLSMGVDPAGHVVITGDFKGTIDFGGPSLTSVGDHDICLARFDTNGTVMWSEGFGDAGNHPPQKVCVDGAGNSYLAVSLAYATVDFGGGPLTSTGLDDIYLASFDSGGNHRWSDRFGEASSFQSAMAMAVAPAGPLFMAGSNGGSFDFGGTPLTNGEFLAGFTSGGSNVSAEDYGGGFTTVAIAVDAWGSLVMAGDKTTAVDFGGGSIAQIGYNDVFIAKYATAATPVANTHARPFGVRALPNPFNPTTRITYSVPAAGTVSLRVFDVAGRLVETLVDDAYRPAGTYTVAYRARGASGVYFVRLDAGGDARTFKIVLLK